MDPDFLKCMADQLECLHQEKSRMTTSENNGKGGRGSERVTRQCEKRNGGTPTVVAAIAAMEATTVVAVVGPLKVFSFSVIFLLSHRILFTARTMSLFLE